MNRENREKSHKCRTANEKGMIGGSKSNKENDERSCMMTKSCSNNLNMIEMICSLRNFYRIKAE